MSVTPVHFHKSKVYNKTNIILLLIPALIFFLVITIYLTTIQVPAKRQSMILTTESGVLGDDYVDNIESIYLK